MLRGFSDEVFTCNFFNEATQFTYAGLRAGNTYATRTYYAQKSTTIYGFIVCISTSYSFLSYGKRANSFSDKKNCRVSAQFST